MKNNKVYPLLQQLYNENENQFIEWSIQLNNNEENFFRFKPTIYIYPNSDKSNFKKIFNVLKSLKTPEELLHIQEDSIQNCLYQGIRIPESEKNEKCLYVHEEGQSFIHAYRWKNEKQFERCLYHYRPNDKLSHIENFIHPELNKFYKALEQGQEYNRLYGNWTQETEEGIHEIYLSFPSRPTLEWVLDAFTPILSKKTIDFLSQFKSCCFKNIGFDSKLENTKKITVYFSIPIPKIFPTTHHELINYTKKFFSNNIK